VDINPRTVADVIHDLNAVPYPFSDNEFDIIIAEHVLEHLGNLIQIVEELHRILKPGGLLYVEVPHFSNSGFFTDPTHTHAFSTKSFDYFIPGTHLYEYSYSQIAFKKRKVVLNFKGGNAVRQMIGRWINSHQDTFEKKLTFIFPRELINFELEAVK
jgi:SAM-dependent methyltransferase